MLSKSFKSNKFYEVTRYWFKYGNEDDALENTVTVWDSFEKAIAYIERYATGLKFESASIEEVIVDREITANDYKHGDYEYVSTQKVYDVTDDCVEDFTKEEICYFKKSEPVNEVEQADEDEERFSIVKSSCGYVTYLDGNPIMASRTLKDAETIKKHFLKDVRKHKSRDKPP